VHPADSATPSPAAPSADALASAAGHLAGLAVPAGSLGRLGELGVWLCGAQGQVPPAPLDDVRLVVLAGDHGVAHHGVSTVPPQVTEALVRLMVSGRAGVNALAAAHGVKVRVLDIGLDADTTDLGDVAAHKVRRGSGAIHLEDALTAEQVAAALAVGRQVARDDIEAGAQLLITGDVGIGNTTPAAALVAAGVGLPAEEVTGRGTGIDDATWQHKCELVAAALSRAGDRLEDPVETLAAVGSADLAATTGLMLEAASSGVPVLLDGLMAVACALTAERIAPGSAAWFVAGTRSTEPGQAHALKALGLEPLLDLSLRLGEGSGAVAAVPLLRSAVALMREVAPITDVLPG